MNLDEMIFSLIKSSSHTWVRYSRVTENKAMELPGEYIEIRTGFLNGSNLDPFFAVGFKIDKINTNKINQDAYCDMLLKRDLIISSESKS